jgi:hypothetical protein
LVADVRTFAERGFERDEGRFISSSSREQEVSFIDAGIGTTLGGDERQEPEQDGADGGCHCTVEE